jgi:hypothetical protein
MKITKTRLRRIIKEELGKVLSEAYSVGDQLSVAELDKEYDTGVWGGSNMGAHPILKGDDGRFYQMANSRDRVMYSTAVTMGRTLPVPGSDQMDPRRPGYSLSRVLSAAGVKSVTIAKSEAAEYRAQQGY